MILSVGFLIAGAFWVLCLVWALMDDEEAHFMAGLLGAMIIMGFSYGAHINWPAACQCAAEAVK